VLQKVWRGEEGKAVEGLFTRFRRSTGGENHSRNKKKLGENGVNWVGGPLTAWADERKKKNCLHLGQKNTRGFIEGWQTK